MSNLTIVWVLKAGVQVVLVIVVIEHVTTVHAAAFTWFFGRPFGWGTLAVAGCCRLFAGRPAVRVALGLAVVPGWLQAGVRGLQVRHRQHALDGLLCTGGCRWLTVSPSTHITKHNCITLKLPVQTQKILGFRVQEKEPEEHKKHQKLCRWLLVQWGTIQCTYYFQLVSEN